MKRNRYEFIPTPTRESAE